MTKRKKAISIALLAVITCLLFVISFEIGHRYAVAQSNEELEALANMPTTARFTEIKDQLSATVTPEVPGANEKVVINVVSYSFDINSALITWKLNGKVVAQSIGKTSYEFTTGALGSANKVEVTIKPTDRPEISKTFSFTPGEVDLLWQAETYTHPFYKGKAQYTPEARITFVALPVNRVGAVRPSETIFNWRVNNTNYADKSGFGRNTYAFDGPILIRPVEVKVEARAAGDSANISTADLTLEPISPSVIFYEDHPTAGVLFNKSLKGSIFLEKQELKLAAYPYFQTLMNKNSDTLYTWSIDGNIPNVSNNQNTITLRRQAGGAGQSSVSVQSQTPMKILQTVSNNLIIRYSPSSSGF